MLMIRKARRSRLLAIFILMGLAILLAGCGDRGARSSDREEAYRLLDGGDRLSAAGPELPADLSKGPPEIGKVPAPGAASRIAMASEGRLGYDARVALLAGAETRYRYRVRVPEGGVLRLGLGHPKPAPDEPPHRIRFQVSVEASSDESRRLLDEVMTTRPENEWRDRSLRLEPWAGREVTLVLATDGEPGSMAAWSAPEIDSAAAKEPAGWDVVLVSLDTLRADHLGAYGYHRPTSPNLDALAKEGILFTTAISQAPWTRPSHLSLFTSLYPVEAARPATPTLAEVLWRHGYRTTALTGAGQIDYRFHVFPRGFESYRASRWIEKVGVASDLLSAGRSRKELLFLHSYKVHDPYEEPQFAVDLPRGRLGPTFNKKDWSRLGHRLDPDEQRYVTALYDGGIALADRQIGELLRRLREARLLDRIILVITSDHGEQLWDHGSWRHGMNMYDHQLHVPLIVRLPPPLARELAARRGGGAGGLVIRQQVELIDVYPTLLDLLGLPRPAGLRGRSLRPLLEGAKLPAREAFAENTNIRAFERKAIRTERFKFIVSIPRGGGRKRALKRAFELYDLRRDPREQTNLAALHPDVVGFLDKRLRAIRGTAAGTLQDELPDGVDAELRAQLRALGYGAN